MDNSDIQVFIVGSPRSGTSILGSAIRKSLGLENKYSEFHIFSFYTQMKMAVDNFFELPTSKEASKIKGMLLHDVNKDFFNKRVKRFIKIIYRESLENKSFVDKTPGLEMVNNVPEILSIWPNAKIIYAKRRGIENVASRLRKFKNNSFENHCTQWSRTMQNWLQIKQQLGDKNDRFIEVDQHDIAKNPEEVSNFIGSFLNLNQEQTIKLKAEFINKNPERTSNSYDSLSFETIDWKDEMKSIFQRVAGDMMEEYNYTYKDNYKKT